MQLPILFITCLGVTDSCVLKVLYFHFLGISYSEPVTTGTNNALGTVVFSESPIVSKLHFLTIDFLYSY